MEYEPILPLRMIAFQVLFLMAAIATEAGLYRQRLKLGFQKSVQYALFINLAAVVAGWLAFLVVEPLAPIELKSQILSYIFFDRLLVNSWSTGLGIALLALGLLAFFSTYLIKAKGLEYILRVDGAWEEPEKLERPSREERYLRARQGRSEVQQAVSEFTDTVLQANAASFSVILLLLVLRMAAVNLN